MYNNNFAANLAAVEKHSCGIKPSKRLYFCWTEEQLEQLTALWDTMSRTCKRATVCRYAIRSSTAATAPDRPVSRSFWSARALGHKQKPQCVHISNVHADLLPTDVYSGMYARVTVV